MTLVGAVLIAMEYQLVFDLRDAGYEFPVIGLMLIALGAVMMIAWAGMSAGGYLGGVLFDLSRGYTASFVLAGIAGILNLAVIGAITATRTLAQISDTRSVKRFTRPSSIADQCESRRTQDE